MLIISFCVSEKNKISYFFTITNKAFFIQNDWLQAIRGYWHLTGLWGKFELLINFQALNLILLINASSFKKKKKKIITVFSFFITATGGNDFLQKMFTEKNILKLSYLATVNKHIIIYPPPHTAFLWSRGTVYCKNCRASLQNIIKALLNRLLLEIRKGHLTWCHL